MKPNKSTINSVARLGQWHDWLNGGAPGAFHYCTNSTYYDMPYHSNHAKVRGVYLEGGKWLAYKRTVNHGGVSISRYRRGYALCYKGTMRVTKGVPSGYSDAELYAFFADLETKGAEAWAKLKPAQPDFSAAVSVAELREIPSALKLRLSSLLKNKGRDAWEWLEGRGRRPRRSKEKLKSFKDKSFANIVGDGYLQFFFGWLPLAKDIKNFVETFQNRKKIFDQLLKDEGRPVKRSCKISSPAPTTTTSVVTHYNSGKNNDLAPTFVTQCYVSGYDYLVTTTTTVETTVETWAVGKFRYFLPPGPRGKEWKKMIMRRIFGLRITPQTLYNLMPWSWLVDYFTDLGKFVDAVSSGVEDNLYAEYAYIMRKVTRKTTYTCTENYYYNLSGGATLTATKVITDVVKMRVAANRFGFGFKEQDLSLKQQGILGALGLSRL